MSSLADDNRTTQLIELARGGSADALGELIGTVRAYLLWVANHELEPGLHAKVAPSDVVQDVCLTAQQRFDDFRGATEHELRAWLRQVLLNSLADSRKKFVQSQKRQLSREVSIDSGFGLPANEISPRASMIAREEREVLHEALDRLPEEHQQVLKMRNWELLSFAEIGKNLIRSEDAAQKLWSRAVMRLDQELKKNP